MDTYLLQIFNGLSVSSILMLVALGLAITFGVMGVINMAHGEFIMIGAYTTYVVQQLCIQYLPINMFNGYFFIAIIAAFIVTAIIGLAIERLIICHLYGRPLDSLLATWGVSIILQQLARSIFGAPNVDVKSPEWLNGALMVSTTLQLPYKRLFIIAIAICCLVAIYYLIYKSNYGRKIRAVMQNRRMAACLGINTRKIDAVTFAFGSGIAGVAGCVLTLLGSIGPSLGLNYIVGAFMVVVLGGVGSLWGAVVGGLIIGTGGTTLEFLTDATLGKVLIFSIVVLFLQWRPKGVFITNSRSLDD